MNIDRLAAAIHNNAVWCDIVCRSHHTPGEFLDGWWINRHITPPFYPNAISLSNDRSTDAYLKPIRNLIDAKISKAWGVKDSYASFDLAPLGFHLLFEAEWIYRSTSLPKPQIDGPDVEWIKLTKETELDKWESAWNNGASKPTRLFLPDLLVDKDVAIIAAYQDRKIVAGAIANRTGDVVGLSNLFLPQHNRSGFRMGCLAHTLELFPDRDLVGYDSGIDLDEMRSIDFEAIGPLRVWECTALI